MCEIVFTLYEKYLLLSGRVWVYFHPGAVKSRQSASCWRQPILNPILFPFPKIILPPRYLFIYINWTWWVVDLVKWIAFPIFQSRTVPWPNIYKWFQILCKRNESNQSELPIIASDINVKFFTQPFSFEGWHSCQVKVYCNKKICQKNCVFNTLPK